MNMKLFSSKLFLWALALLIVCGVIIGFNLATDRLSPASGLAGVILTPMQQGISRVSGFFSGITDYFTRYNELESENKELKARVLELEKSQRDYYAAVDENTYLRELAGLKKKNSSFDYELAEVIGINTDSVSTVYTLSRGSKDDIEVNDAVVTAEGLVGYVSTVGPNFCQVKPVTDISLKMGAVISRTREVVVAEGSFDLAAKGLLRLSYLKNGSDVLVGDTVESSGYGGIFPKGLLIGTITEVLPESHGISTYAKVRPAADLSSLKKVYIIKDFSLTD